MFKNYSALTLAAVVLIVILVGAYFFVLKDTTYTPTQNTLTVIETPQDLNEADIELGKDSDFDSLDSSLTQLDTELNNF